MYDMLTRYMEVQERANNQSQSAKKALLRAQGAGRQLMARVRGRRWRAAG